MHASGTAAYPKHQHDEADEADTFGLERNGWVALSARAARLVNKNVKKESTTTMAATTTATKCKQVGNAHCPSSRHNSGAAAARRLMAHLARRHSSVPNHSTVPFRQTSALCVPLERHSNCAAATQFEFRSNLCHQPIAFNLYACLCVCGCVSMCLCVWLSAP